MTSFKGSLAMAHTADSNSSPFHVTTQDVAIQMIASVARILLMVGTAILIGEVAAGPAKKLLAARAHHRRTVNEDGEPVD
jgi:hypothetical protein